MNAPRERQVAVFDVGTDMFAVDILQIREIARYHKIRKIPRAPDFLEGVIDLRGDEIVPIIDLHTRLGLELEVELEQSRIIIAPIEDMAVGLMVDAVRDVITVDEDSIQQPPAMDSAPSFLQGVIRMNDDILLLLDISRILSSDEKLHMEELRTSLQQSGKPGKADQKSGKSGDKKKAAGSSKKKSKKKGASK